MATSIKNGGVIGLIFGLAVSGLTVGAQAADLGDVVKALPVKSPLPDALTWNGITLYGAVDVGYGYSTSGAPIGGSYWGINPNAFAAPAGRQAISSLNTLGYSFVGLKIEENIGSGWQAIGRIEAGFDPLTGEFDDACKVNINNNGKPTNLQTTDGDANRCSPINGQAWAGVRNPIYGQVQVGRNNSLASDSVLGFDPVTIYSFSALGWSPGIGGGTGATETARWNDSVKYVYQNELVHAGLMFAQGAQDSSLHGDSYAANFGVTWHGFAVDAVYTVERDAIKTGVFGAGACGTVGTPSCSTLTVTGMNNEALGLMGKYTYDFNGGAKGSNNKLTFYAGYHHIRSSDPSDPLSVGDTTIGGYMFGAVNNTAFLYGDKNVGTVWVGAKYEIGSWAISTAYYRAMQDYYMGSVSATACSTADHSYCSGTWNTASLSAVYTFDKHLDAYAGLVWSNLVGGMAAGYPTPYNTSFLSGVILRF